MVATSSPICLSMVGLEAGQAWTGPLIWYLGSRGPGQESAYASAPWSQPRQMGSLKEHRWVLVGKYAISENRALAWADHRIPFQAVVFPRWSGPSGPYCEACGQAWPVEQGCSDGLPAGVPCAGGDRRLLGEARLLARGHHLLSRDCDTGFERDQPALGAEIECPMCGYHWVPNE